jgi:hypothetical protein
LNASQATYIPRLPNGVPMTALALVAKLASRLPRPTRAYAGNYIDRPYDLPDSQEPSEDLDESSEPDDFTLDEDDQWEVFVADDDEFDVEPDPRDFDEGGNDAWTDDE